VLVALEATEGELAKQLQTNKEMKEADKNIQQFKAKIGAYEDAGTESTRVVEKFETKINYLRTQSKTKTASAQKQLDDTQTELLVVEKDRREGKARIEHSEAQKRKVEVAIEEDGEKAEKEIQDMVAQYRAMEEVVVKNQNGLMSAMAC